MNQLQHLNRLSELNANKGVRFLHSAASPGSHCPMHTALAFAKRMQGVSTLVVGTPECGYYSRFVMDTPYGTDGELHYVYEMDSNEVVFGCREGLMKAIRQMEEEGAAVILLVITCVPALIGEDAKALIEELKGKLQAKLFYVDVAHFKRNGYQSGYYLFYEKLADILEAERYGQGTGINILGSGQGSEAAIFINILQRNDVAVNEFTFDSPVSQLEMLLGAEVSVVLSVKMLGMAKALHQRYGIPYIALCNRYHPEEIAEGYREVFDLFGIQDGEELTVRYRELLDLQERVKELIQGLRYMSAHPDLEVTVSAYLCRLGMIPVLLHVEEYYEEDTAAKEQILARGHNPYITYITNKNRLMEAVAGEKIDLSVGECKDFPEGRSIPDRELYQAAGLYGYEKTERLLRLLAVSAERKE